MSPPLGNRGLTATSALRPQDADCRGLGSHREANWTGSKRIVQQPLFFLLKCQLTRDWCKIHGTKKMLNNHHTTEAKTTHLLAWLEDVWGS